ncbi:hypothetical protein VCHA51O448_100138 [Vibrio chagasii]|nr:hypothetical protein VCHA50O387_100138 [Vibrio chagasii]CAH6954261.1 hypothetical protein VCHA51O448_100138 [Vibrio chagasii]CAH7349540.1 hypothetical protein VCHA50O409_80138 [Vibrio chagasii]CAH7386355.1 hypothetical protein VCHA50O402_70138 [Vibrio chagasii]
MTMALTARARHYSVKMTHNMHTLCQEKELTSGTYHVEIP